MNHAILCACGILLLGATACLAAGPAEPTIVSGPALNELRARSIFIVEDANLIRFAGVKTGQPDQTAADGYAAVIAPDAPAFFQCALRLGSGLADLSGGKVLPGFTFRIYAVAKVVRKGTDGTALRFGIYDEGNRRYVCADTRPALTAVPDGEWFAGFLGECRSLDHVLTYVGPTTNAANVQDLRVDCFLLVADSDEQSLREEWARLGKVIPFHFAGEGDAAVSLQFTSAAAAAMAIRPIKPGAEPVGSCWTVEGGRPGALRAVTPVKEGVRAGFDRFRCAPASRASRRADEWRVTCRDQPGAGWTGLLLMQAHADGPPQCLEVQAQSPSEGADGISPPFLGHLVAEARSVRFASGYARLRSTVGGSWWRRLWGD